MAPVLPLNSPAVVAADRISVLRPAGAQASDAAASAASVDPTATHRFSDASARLQAGIRRGRRGGPGPLDADRQPRQPRQSAGSRTCSRPTRAWQRRCSAAASPAAPPPWPRSAPLDPPASSRSCRRSLPTAADGPLVPYPDGAAAATPAPTQQPGLPVVNPTVNQPAHAPGGADGAAASWTGSAAPTSVTTPPAPPPPAAAPVASPSPAAGAAVPGGGNGPGPTAQTASPPTWTR